MGISLETAESLIEEFRKRNIGGRVLTLGKQDLSFTLDELLMVMARMGLVTVDGTSVRVDQHQNDVIRQFMANGCMFARKPEYARLRYVSDEFFFRFIGFDAVASVDNSAYENATFVHDLNLPGMAALVGAYDLVYDGGTMEHVFHVPNLLTNIFDALAVGGWVLHHAPTNNYVDHGFYQFSPTFFYDYYGTNDFSDIAIRFGRSSGGLSTGRNYYPGGLESVPPGSLDGAMYGTQCYARKTAQSTGDRIPQQGEYVEVWRSGNRSRNAVPLAVNA